MVKRLEQNSTSFNSLIKNSKTNTSRIKNLMNDQLQPFYITPVQVLIVSLFFIGTVFVLHLYARFSSTSGLQLFVSGVVFVVSMILSYELNKRL